MRKLWNLIRILINKNRKNDQCEPVAYTLSPKMVKIINFFVIIGRTFKYGQYVAFGSLISYQ